MPAKYQKWRKFQIDAIKSIDTAAVTTALLLPPGAGKSGIYIAWALWRKKRVMILTPNKFLQDQLYKDFSGIGLVDMRGQSNYTCAISGGAVADAPCHGGFVCSEKPRCEYFAKLKRAPSERFLLSNPSFWFHNKHVLGEFDALIIDECFVGDTKIATATGEKRIDAVCKGDLIESSLGESKVISTFSKLVNETVEVRLSDGRSFECTADHPICTPLGWRPAGSLDRGTRLLRREEVRRLWHGVSPVFQFEGRPHGGTHRRSAVFEEDRLRAILLEEAEEPDAQRGISGENDQNFAENRAPSQSARGQRTTPARGTEKTAETSGCRMGNGGGSSDAQESRPRVPSPLQSRSLEPLVNARGRVGWPQPRPARKTCPGQKKGRVFKGVWVESVTHKKHPRGVLVYNLRAERHPSYFANGVLAHNCHRAFDTIADHVSITFKKKEIQTWFHRPPTRDWKAWASYQKTIFAGKLREMKDKFRKSDEDYDEIRIVKRLLDKVSSLSEADPKTLIYQQTMTGWTWDVVWPGAYRSLLTSHAKKFVFTSGTMTRRTMGMLGYTKDEYDWNEYPSTFPIARCPIHVLPAPRMNASTGASETRIWLEMMDRYMDSRKDRRGLIHSGSYQRAGFIATESRHASRMFVHTNSAGLPEAMERFLKSENGILVSPSIIEGTDFPYDAARFQIIGKLFFTDPRDPVAAERKRQDPQYPWYTAAMKVMQARGRVNRAADDFGETAICDGSWQDWFYKAAAHHFTAYFRAAIQVLHIVPDAAPIATNTLITGVSQKSQKVLDVPAPISAQYPSQPPAKKKAVPLFTENNPPILEKK